MAFLCHHCGKEFGTKLNYTRHVASLHFGEGGVDPNDGSYLVSCPYCSKQYKRKENLQKHICKIHKPEESDIYMRKCEICDNKIDKTRYKRHMIIHHSPRIDDISDKPKVNCSVCSANFNSNASLNYHKKKVHNITSNKEALTIKCPLCDFVTKLSNTQSIQEHFADIHEIQTQNEFCQFNTIEEFYNWKFEIEKQTRTKYVRTRTESDVLMFKCQRSGKYNPASVQRNVRASGSCKINGFCPAFIKAKIVNSNEIHVTYQLIHIGHENTLHHIPLSHNDGKTISVQLAKNITCNEILENLRGSIMDEPLQRVHLTNRKDIHNIKKSFDLNSIAVEHSFDLKGEEDDNIFNIKTKLAENLIDENLEKVDSMKVVEKPFDYNSIAVEHSFDLSAEEVQITYNVEVVSVDEPMENTDTYQEIEIHQDYVKPVDYNEEEIQYTYSIPVKSGVQPVVFHSEVASSVEGGEVIVYNPNLETVSFDHIEENIEYSNYNVEVVEEPDIVTEEAVKNLLGLNKTDFKPFLDSESLEKWVNKLKVSQNTSLAVYKAQGHLDPEFPGLGEDDFLLIFMTETQKDILLKYSQDIIFIEFTKCHNIQSYALLVPDETRDGFPVAFMFTNRGDELDMSIFFTKVRDVVGTVTSKAFMTDVEEMIYSVWMKIMGEDVLHLYCYRQVVQELRENIKSKIKVKDKRNETYKTLQSMIQELDEIMFHKMLSECQAKWSKDEDMCAFLKYFQNLFVVGDKVKKWAYFYRVNTGINTNVSIDSFNRILKYCDLRGDKVKTSNKTLCDVLNLLRVKLFELVIKINKGKVAKKLQNLRLRHGHSYANDAEYVFQEEDKWRIQNYVSDEISESYIVKKLKECNSCLLQCHQCNSCFHEYVCSCADHLMKNNMCKHIHLVARTQKLMEKDADGTEGENSLEISTAVKTENGVDILPLSQIKNSVQICAVVDAINSMETAGVEADSGMETTIGADRTIEKALLETDNNVEIDGFYETDNTRENSEIGVQLKFDSGLPLEVRKRLFIEEVKKCLEENVESLEELEFFKGQFQPILSNLSNANLT